MYKIYWTHTSVRLTKNHSSGPKMVPTRIAPKMKEFDNEKSFQKTLKTLTDKSSNEPYQQGFVSDIVTLQNIPIYIIK